jgi:hypothetical protein
MSDGVLAAIIAAGATVFTSFVQLRSSFAKEIAARARSAAQPRGKSHIVPVLLVVMLVGATVGGFALAQWMHEDERDAQQALERDLRERIGDLTRYKNEIEQTRTELRSVVQTDVLRRIGADGVAVLATAAPCKLPVTDGRTATPIPAGPAASAAPAAAPSASQTAHAQSPAPACSESDAAPIVLCATIPAAAQLGNVDLYLRQSDSAGHWSDSRVMPGEASAEARFASKPVELADGPGMKQVCIGFTQWSDQTRIARMVVHYSL